MTALTPLPLGYQLMKIRNMPTPSLTPTTARIKITVVQVCVLLSLDMKLGGLK
jgi:hypothetical protein